MKLRRDHLFVAAIIAFGWVFWLQKLGVNDHPDTVANELLFARAPVTTLLCCIPWPDQSPLYFLYLHVARLFGESPFAIQLLNGLLLTCSLIAAYSVARAFSDSRASALLALFLGAISPASLWLVRNGRMYSIQVLLTVLSFLFVLRYLERRRRGDLATFALLCVLNIYNHFVGFLITAVLYAPVLVDAWRRSRRQGVDEGEPGDARQGYALPALAAAGIFVLALPQIVRFVMLMGDGVPLRSGISLRGLSPGFFARVGWFWFMNTDWGSLRRGEAVLTLLYLGSIVVLASGGLMLLRRGRAAVAGLSILLPLVGLSVAAARLDVRDRYFVWALPLLWIAIAAGAAGPLPARLPSAARDVLTGVRAALFLTVATGSLWLLWNKLPERYPEWTKLMVALQQVYRPSMVVYMPPGPLPGPSSLTGMPRWIGSALDMPRGLQDVRELTSQTRTQFLAEAGDARDFVFLVHWNYGNDEITWRTRYLEEQRYKKALLTVWGAHAQIYTQRELGGFSRPDRIAPNSSPAAIVAWVRQRISARPATPRGAPALAEAAVARIRSDGTLREGRVFASQRGENGVWKLGPLEWDVVQEMRTPSGGVERDVILAHPETDSVLVVAFPAIEMKKSLELTYGIADSGLGFKSGADVRLAVYVGGVKKAEIASANTPGWNDLSLETEGLSGQTADVVLLISTVDDRSRHFAFHFATSSRAVAVRPLETNGRSTGDLVLTGGQTLSASLGRLNVHRDVGGRRIDAWRDPQAYSATEMHEAEGRDGIGSVRGRWALGPLLWDAVGLTRQRSGGEAREGLWAHAKNGTTLVIEAPNAMLGSTLRGFYGLTDYAVAAAAARGVTAPVRFTISIDGQPALERAAARSAGWRAFDTPVPGGPGTRSLRIEITSASESWAHFVFDLSSN